MKHSMSDMLLILFGLFVVFQIINFLVDGFVYNANPPKSAQIVILRPGRPPRDDDDDEHCDDDDDEHYEGNHV